MMSEYQDSKFPSPAVRRFGQGLAVALLLCAASCTPPGADDSGADDEEEPSHVMVETITLESTAFIETLNLTGETEAIRSLSVASEAGGRITRLSLEEGALIEEGDILVRIDTSQQGAQAAQLQAVLNQLDVDIERTERLLERGLATRADLQSLESQRSSTFQQLRGASIGVGNGVTRAPFGGVVSSKDAETGEYANPGQILGRIVDTSTIKVMIDLPAREISNARVGDTADVEIPALGRTFEAEIRRIGVEANQNNRTFPVELHIDNADGELRAGMRANVSIVKSNLQDVVAAPLDAMLQGLNGSEAVVVRDHKSQVVNVTVGPTRGGYGVILEGLQAGDELVIRGQRDLVDDEPVEPVNTGTCCREQLTSYGIAVAANTPSDADEAADAGEAGEAAESDDHTGEEAQ